MKYPKVMTAVFVGTLTTLAALFALVFVLPSNENKRSPAPSSSKAEQPQPAPPPEQYNNLDRRRDLLNGQVRFLYVYCVGANGNIVREGVAEGKVSSLNSFLAEFDDGCTKNPEGIFWFGPDGSYNEWVGSYYLSDRPQKINSPIALTEEIDLSKAAGIDLERSAK